MGHDRRGELVSERRGQPPEQVAVRHAELLRPDVLEFQFDTLPQALGQVPIIYHLRHGCQLVDVARI